MTSWNEEVYFRTLEERRRQARLRASTPEAATELPETENTQNRVIRDAASRQKPGSSGSRGR